MKKAEKKPVDANAWMATYSDMVTLLMAFFVVLLAMSNTDEQKFNALIRSFSNLPIVEFLEEMGNAEPDTFEESESFSEMDQVYEMLKEHIEENGQEESIIISKYNEVVYIRFNSSLFFEPDKYVLKSASIPTLSFIGEALVHYQDAINVVNVLGFTATVPQGGTYWMLSGERAAVVATHININSGLPSDKLVVMGYGNRYPVATNDTAEGMEQNRRVEIIIVGTDAEDDFSVDGLLESYHNGEDLNVGLNDDVADVAGDLAGDVSADLAGDIVGDVSTDVAGDIVSDVPSAD
ncbi:MAG: flagellar motor protein MotB [Clostridia bacterium]